MHDPEAAAALLVEARRTGRPAAPGTGRIGGADEAYAIQDAVVRQIGPVGGWKVGAASPESPPLAAPLFADLVRPSPCDWPAASLGMIGVEAEIAFRLGRGFAAASPPNDAEILAAIESLHVGIEIVATRLADWAGADPLWKLADNQSNGGYVYDPAGITAAGHDLAQLSVRLAVNGETAVAVSGGNPGGDPRRLAIWLVRHVVGRCGTIAPGTLVTTGSYTGLVFVEPGAVVEASFAGLGAAKVRFTL